MQVELPRWFACRLRSPFSPPPLGLRSRLGFPSGSYTELESRWIPSKKTQIGLSNPHQRNPKHPYKDPDDGRQRFLLELEFVQCLANPAYIHCEPILLSISLLLDFCSYVFGNFRYLAQNRYLEDEAFIGYLKYLQYWQRPDYIKYIMYPHCLFFLELLQNENFRNAMAHPGSKELAHRQQYFFWKNYRNNRLKHIVPRPLPEPVAPLPPTPPAPMPPMAVASTPVLSPMQVVAQPGSALPKVDMRNSMADRRKRKKEG